MLTKQNESDYIKYRGKCKEFVERAISEDNTLRAVRGYYYCPVWGKQAHWWCEKPDGTVYDPTAKQFPSKGMGVYKEFNGLVYCSECGKEMLEHEASYDSNYCFCSTQCHMIFVGL